MKRIHLAYLLSLALLLTGCSQNTESTTSTFSRVESAVDSEYGQATRLSFGEPMAWGTELATAQIAPKVSDWKQFPIEEERDIWNFGVVDSTILLSLNVPPEDAGAQQSTQMEVAALDPESGSMESLGIYPHQYDGAAPCFTVANRYYVMTWGYYEEEQLMGCLMIYDAFNGQLQQADSYAVESYDFVQYAGAVGDDGVAYWYEEAGTGEVVVKYYAFAKKQTTEIWRQERVKSDGFAPVAISGNDTGIALLLQRSDNTLSVEGTTKLRWFGTDGTHIQDEQLPIEDYTSRTDPTIQSFSLTGNWYSIQLKYVNNISLFQRDGDVLIPLAQKEPLPQIQYELANAGKLYFSTMPQSGAMLSAMQMDLEAETLTYYNVNGDPGMSNYKEYFANDAALIICMDPTSLSTKTSSYYFRTLQ